MESINKELETPNLFIISLEIKVGFTDLANPRQSPTHHNIFEVVSFGSVDPENFTASESRRQHD